MADASAGAATKGIQNCEEAVSETNGHLKICGGEDILEVELVALVDLASFYSMADKLSFYRF